MESHYQTILDILISSFLFCGLNSLPLSNISRKATIKSYSPGEILFDEDVTNDKIMMLLEGMVKIYKLTPEGKEIFLAIEKSGNYLGVMELADNPGTTTIEAIVPTKVLILYKNDVAALLKQFPFLWERMYKIVLAKLEEMKQFQHIRLANDLTNRTYLLLSYLSQFFEGRRIALSQENLASIVGATRPRVTEALHALRDAKKISISSKKITLLT